MSKVRILLLCVLSLSVSLPALYAQEASFPPHEKKVLFSLAFGKKWQNVNAGWPKKTDKEWFEPVGPVGLSVHSEKIYIGDRLNGCVKWFSIQGKFLGKTPTSRDYLLDFAVAKDGSIFTLEHTDGRSWHKFDAQGKKLWSVSKSAVFAPNWGIETFQICALPEGQLGVCLSSLSRKQKLDKVAVFDKSGRWIYTVLAYGGNEDGVFYNLQYSGQTQVERNVTLQCEAFRIKPESLALQAETQEKNRQEIAQAAQRAKLGYILWPVAPKIRSDETTPLATLIFKPPPQVHHWMKVTDEGKIAALGGGGNLKLTGFTMRKHHIYVLASAWGGAKSAIEKEQGVKSLDVLVLSYDWTGKSYGFVRFDDSPLLSPFTPTYMDEQDNIYAMMMTPKGFDIVRYRPKETFAVR